MLMRKIKLISLGKAFKWGFFASAIFAVGFSLGNYTAISFCADVAVRTLQRIGADQDLVDRLVAYVEHRI